MRMFGIVAATATVLAATGATAQGVSPACGKFDEAIQTGAKNLAWLHANKLTQSTAIEASQIAADEANAIALMRLNVELMVAAKCPLPAQPITRGAYVASARACLQRKEGVEDILCNRQLWTPTPDAVEPALTPK